MAGVDLREHQGNIAILASHRQCETSGGISIFKWKIGLAKSGSYKNKFYTLYIESE